MHTVLRAHGPLTIILFSALLHASSSWPLGSVFHKSVPSHLGVHEEVLQEIGCLRVKAKVLKLALPHFGKSCFSHFLIMALAIPRLVSLKKHQPWPHHSTLHLLPLNWLFPSYLSQFSCIFWSLSRGAPQCYLPQTKALAWSFCSTWCSGLIFLITEILMSLWHICALPISFYVCLTEICLQAQRFGFIYTLFWERIQWCLMLGRCATVDTCCITSSLLSLLLPSFTLSWCTLTMFAWHVGLTQALFSEEGLG